MSKALKEIKLNHLFSLNNHKTANKIQSARIKGKPSPKNANNQKSKGLTFALKCTKMSPRAARRLAIIAIFLSIL
jgi:hypothetical protein